MLKLGVVARLCIDHPLAATAPARPSASAQPRKAYPAWRSSASPAAPSNAVSHARLKCGSVRLSVADHEATASSRLRTTMLPFRVKGGSNLNSGIGLSDLPSMRPRVGFAPALARQFLPTIAFAKAGAHAARSNCKLSFVASGVSQHHVANSSSNAFASFRSRVWKPSVNHP